MMPHTVPNRPTYGLVEPTVASVARLCSSRSISFSCATRIARRAPSSSCSGVGRHCWRWRANSRKPNSKMLAMPVAPPRDSMPRYSCDRSPPDQKLFSNWSASRRARRMTHALAEDDGPGGERGEQQQRDARSAPACSPASTRRMIDRSGHSCRRSGAASASRQKCGQSLRSQGARIDAGDAHLRLDEQARRARVPARAEMRCAKRSAAAPSALRLAGDRAAHHPAAPDGDTRCSTLDHREQRCRDLRASSLLRDSRSARSHSVRARSRNRR